MLKLNSDDQKQVYVWTDEQDHPVSAHFDYEQDALEWKQKNLRLFEQSAVSPQERLGINQPKVKLR